MAKKETLVMVKRLNLSTLVDIYIQGSREDYIRGEKSTDPKTFKSKQAEEHNFSYKKVLSMKI